MDDIKVDVTETDVCNGFRCFRKSHVNMVLNIWVP